jgi:hypothetical protein
MITEQIPQEMAQKCAARLYDASGTLWQVVCTLRVHGFAEWADKVEAAAIAVPTEIAKVLDEAGKVPAEGL